MNILRKNFLWKRENPFQAIHGFWNMNYSSGYMKPPNIVIVGDEEDLLTKWRNLLGNVLSQETYVIYQLPQKDFIKGFWKSNVSLLVLDQLNVFEAAHQYHIDQYLSGGGNVFSHCNRYPPPEGIEIPLSDCGDCVDQEESCDFTAKHGIVQFKGILQKDVKALLTNIHSDVFCTTSHGNQPVLVLNKQNNGTIATSAINFHKTLDKLQLCEENNESVLLLLRCIAGALGLKCAVTEEQKNPEITPGLVFGEPEMVSAFLGTLRESLENRHTQQKTYLGLELVDEEFLDASFSSQKDGFRILAQRNMQSVSCYDDKFDYKRYRKALRTRKIGRLLVYASIVTSTQTILESVASLLPDSHGFVVVAGQQTQGKGRGGNVWLSPVGCMMFSLVVKFSSSSLLGNRMPFLQHVAAVAFVKSVRSKQGYEGINVCIKWPNDVYVGDSVKIGGLIVNSSYMNGEFHAIIGMGVNITNKKPTVCLNSVIEQYNREHNTNLQYFKTEELLAATLTNIEKLLLEFEEQGEEEFCKIYYRYWLHSNQKVKLEAENGADIIVRGLDANGFLLVENQLGEKFSLQPDGNSFDMMQGLIKIKSRT